MALTKEQIKKLFKAPRTALQSNQSLMGVTQAEAFQSGDDDARQLIEANNKTWVSITKSLVTNQAPYIIDAEDNKIELTDSIFRLSTTDFNEFLNNTNVDGCLKSESSVFDVNRAFATFYAILWQQQGRKGPGQNQDILSYGSTLYEKGLDFWKRYDQLSAEFGSKWVKQKQWIEEPDAGKTLAVTYTGLILPVHRAADARNDDLYGCKNETPVNTDTAGQGYANVSGWRVNRKDSERRQYDGRVHTPTWLNYQMACTNPRKTPYGTPVFYVRVKDDFFQYSNSHVMQANKETQTKGTLEYATVEKAYENGFNSTWPFYGEENTDGSRSIMEVAPRKEGSWLDNVEHWQYYDDYLPYWNLVHPWRKVSENEQPGIPWFSTKNFSPNTSDYDHADQSDGKGNKPFKEYVTSGNKVLNLKHGSLYGTGMPATDFKHSQTAAQNINNFGFMKNGLFDGKSSIAGVLQIAGDIYGFGEKKLNGKSYDTDDVPFDLIIDFFKGQRISNKTTDSVCGFSDFDASRVPSAAEELLRQNYFGFDREAKANGWEGNRGGMGYALEPLKFVALDKKEKGKDVSLKFQTAFYFFSWAFKLLDETIKANASVFTMDDIPFNDPSASRYPMSESENRKQHAFYEFLLNFVYDLLYFSKIQIKSTIPDKLPEPSKNTPLIGKGDTFNDAAKRQIIENAQCYMLNTIDIFAREHTSFTNGFNLQYDSILITQEKSGRASPAFGGVKCDHFLNLLGKRDDVLDKFLNIRPADLALLQPRIRLFKQRKVTNPKTGRQDQKPVRVQVPGPFETHINTESINSILAQRKGRMLGAGITEINIRSEGGNKAWDRDSLVTAEIKFHFNRLEEIFLNWPVYPNKEDGTIDYNNPDYPFGISPGYTKENAPASIAELVFPPRMNPDDITLGKFTDFGAPDFQIMLEVGWSVPRNFFDNSGNGIAADIVKQLQQKTLYKTFFLRPHSSEFDIAENGTIGLTVEYYDIPDTLLGTRKNKLFPSLFLDNFDTDVQRSVTKKRQQISDIKEKEEGPLSQADQSKIDRLKSEIKSEVESAQDDKLANFLHKKVAMLFGYLMGLKGGDHRGDKGAVPQQDPNRQINHRINLSYTLLGIYGDKKKVKRWKPYRELGNLSDVKFFRTTPGNEAVTFGKDGLVPTSNVLKNAATTAASAAKILQDTRRTLKNNDKATAIRYKQKANKLLNSLSTDSLNSINEGNKDSVSIDFIYFGDFVQTLIDVSHMDGESFINEGHRVNREDLINLIFGCLSIPLVGRDGVIRTVPVKVTDIPIVSNILVDFIVNYMIKTEKYDVSYIGLAVAFYRWFLKTYFSNKCFLGVREITTMHPEINFFSMYGLDKTASTNPHPLTFWEPHERNPAQLDLRSKGIAYSPGSFSQKMDEYDQKIKDGQYNKNASYHFCYLGGQTVGEGTYSYKDDLAKNIYHFYIGRDSGIVKNIQFKASELEGRAEAEWSVTGDSLNQAMFMIPRVYDVTVTLIGNHLFEPGQTFFVNPTLGTSLSLAPGKELSQSEILKNTGLGGYYYINNMETRVKEGLFETVIEGIKIGLASSKDVGMTLNSITAEDFTQASISDLQEQMDKEKKRTGETRGFGDELSDYWRDLTD